MTITRSKCIGLIAVTAVLLLLPLIFSGDYYIMNMLVACIVWAAVAESWNLMIGYAYVFSFGQVAFFVTGEYCSGMLCKYFGLNPWLGILAGGVGAMIIALILVAPCLRIRGVYVSIVTYSFATVLSVLIRYFGTPNYQYSTYGTYGLAGLPPLYFGNFTLDRYNPTAWYFIALALSGFFIFIIYKIINSRIGLAFVSLRDSLSFATSIGVNEFKYKVLAFAITSFIAGAMGGFYSSYLSIITPSTLELEMFIVVFLMMQLGGNRFLGSTIGAFFMTILNELLRPTGTWRLVCLGILIIICATYMPNGIIGLLEKITKWVVKKLGRKDNIEPS
ncbi:MAG: branched-chain amino acid ABC transporter permease [Oscillospiraceae bacterium]|nr:branched-chain amino acid ABC transporter permease [Oscillospiraceae bacterium]